MLNDQISKHDFNYQMVTNTRWNPSKFTTLSGKEHLMEKEISDFGRHLFFEGKFCRSRSFNFNSDKLNLYELYNGVLTASTEAPSLGI